jgi:hypothetical protein
MERGGGVWRVKVSVGSNGEALGAFYMGGGGDMRAPGCLQSLVMMKH